jgi:hypothetical protein
VQIGKRRLNRMNSLQLEVIINVEWQESKNYGALQTVQTRKKRIVLHIKHKQILINAWQKNF